MTELGLFNVYFGDGLALLNIATCTHSVKGGGGGGVHMPT